MESWSNDYPGNLDKHQYQAQLGTFTVLRTRKGNPAYESSWAISYEDKADLRWFHLGSAASLDEAKRIVTDAVNTGQY